MSKDDEEIKDFDIDTDNISEDYDSLRSEEIDQDYESEDLGKIENTEDNRMSYDPDEVKYVNYKIPSNKKEAIALAKCYVLSDYLNHHNTIFQERDADYKKSVWGHGVGAVAAGLVLATGLATVGPTVGAVAFWGLLSGGMGATAIAKYRQKLKNQDLAKNFFSQKSEKNKESFLDSFEEGEYSKAWDIAKKNNLTLAAPRNLVDKEVGEMVKKFKKKAKTKSFYGKKDADDYKNPSKKPTP